MIIVRDISKSFGSSIAVDRVSFELNDAESLVIVGPSGSGKTTLLRLIAGLERPDSGEIVIDGKIASSPKWILEPHLRGMSFVFQSPALWPHMTIAQNILFGLDGLPSAERKKRLDFLLEKTTLSDLKNRHPDQVSRGEARRASIIRALAPATRYLLMDEPLTNIDPELKKKVMELIIAEVRRTRASLILVTHNADEADIFAGRKLTLRSGRIENPGKGLED